MRLVSYYFLPLLLAAAGCADRPATALVVALSTDEVVRSSIDTVHVSAYRGDTLRFEQSYGLKGGTLPGTLTFFPDEPDDLPGPPLVLLVRGLKSGDDNNAIRRVARVPFLKERSKLLRVRLSASCLGNPCDAQNKGLTCDEGKCIPEEVDTETLPDFVSNEEAIGATGGSGGSGGGGGAGAGGGGPCSTTPEATIALLADGQPSGGTKVPVDASLELKASVKGGSGNYTMAWSSDRKESPDDVDPTPGPVLKKNANYCSGPETFTLVVTDLDCGLKVTATQTIETEGRGVHVATDCTESEECGSRLRPWCTIGAAQQHFKDKAKPVTLRLAQGSAPFSEAVQMLDGVHLEGGWPVGFAASAPEPSKYTTTLAAPAAGAPLGGVRWQFASGMTGMAADLRNVTIEPLGPKADRALWVEGAVKATIQNVKVPAWSTDAQQGSALVIDGSSADLTLIDDSLRGPDGAATLAGAQSSAIGGTHEGLKLTVSGGVLSGGNVSGQDSRSGGLLLGGGGGVTLTLTSGADVRGGGADQGQSAGLWVVGPGKVTLDGATVVGGPAKGSAQATGVIVDGVSEVLVKGSSVRGGESLGDVTGIEVRGTPPSQFEVRGGTLDGGSGAGDASGLRLTSLTPGAATNAEVKLLEGAVVRGATGPATIGVALRLDWDSTEAGAKLGVAATAQGVTLVGATAAGVKEGKGVYAKSPLDEGQDTAVNLTDCDIEGGTGDEYRVGVWATDAEVQITGGKIAGSRSAGGAVAVGVWAEGVGKPKNAQIKASTGAPEIEGGQPGGTFPAAHGVWVDGAELLTIEGAAIKGCGGPGCPVDGFASGLRILKVTSASISGNDIAGGAFAVGGQSVGLEMLGENGSASILGGVTIEKNKRLVGNPDASKKSVTSVGVRLEAGPVTLASNERIDGGYGKESVGLSAVLAGQPAPGQSLIVRDNKRVTGGQGDNATGALVVGFIGAKVHGNAIDGGGSGCGEGCESRGLALGWLSDSAIHSNQAFGGLNGRSGACQIDTTGATKGQSMHFAHNLCLAPATNGAPGAEAVGLRVFQSQGGTNDPRLVLLQNMLAVGPLEPATKTTSPTRMLLWFEPLDPQTQWVSTQTVQNVFLPLPTPGPNDAYWRFISEQKQAEVKIIKAADVTGQNQVLPVALVKASDANPLEGDHHLDQAACKLQPALKQHYPTSDPVLIGKTQEMDLDFDGEQRGSPPTAGADECMP